MLLWNSPLTLLILSCAFYFFSSSRFDLISGKFGLILASLVRIFFEFLCVCIFSPDDCCKLRFMLLGLLYCCWSVLICFCGVYIKFVSIDSIVPMPLPVSFITGLETAFALLCLVGFYGGFSAFLEIDLFIVGDRERSFGCGLLLLVCFKMIYGWKRLTQGAI